MASAHPFPLPSVNHKRVPRPSKADQERIHQEELVPAWAPFGASSRLASVTFPDLIGADTLDTHDKKVGAIARDFSRSIESRELNLDIELDEPDPAAAEQTQEVKDQRASPKAEKRALKAQILALEERVEWYVSALKTCNEEEKERLLKAGPY